MGWALLGRYKSCRSLLKARTFGGVGISLRLTRQEKRKKQKNEAAHILRLGPWSLGCCCCRTNSCLPARVGLRCPSKFPVKQTASLVTVGDLENKNKNIGAHSSCWLYTGFTCRRSRTSLSASHTGTSTQQVQGAS